MDSFADQKSELQALLPDLSFVVSSETDQYRCSVCHSLALSCRRPEWCNHLFCELCISKIHKSPCPVKHCLNTSVSQIWKDEMHEKNLMNLKVFCAYNKYGCMEMVSLSNILAHTKMCRFSTKNLLPKLYRGSSAGKFAFDEWLEKDQRDKVDQKIIVIITKLMEKLQETILQQTVEIDDKFKKAISESLEISFERHSKQICYELGKLSEKLENRTAIIISQMSKITADDQMKRAKDHSESEQILEMELKMQNKMQSWTESIISENSVTLSWPISSISSKMKDIKCGKLPMISSKMFNPQKYDIQVQAHLRPNLKTNQFGIYFSFLKNQANMWYRAQTNLLDQSTDKHKRDVWRVIDTAFETKIQMQEFDVWGLPYFSPFGFFEKDSPYVKKDSVLVKITLIPCFVLNKYVFLDEGILLWKIDHYSRKKMDGKDGVSDEWQSQDFYSSKSGYKLQIWLNFTDSGLEFSQACLKGSFDKTLPPQFPHKTTLQVFEHTHNSEKRNLVKIVTTDKTNHKIGELNYNEVEDERYLKKDCLLIKVTVETVK